MNIRDEMRTSDGLTITAALRASVDLRKSIHGLRPWLLTGGPAGLYVVLMRQDSEVFEQVEITRCTNYYKTFVTPFARC